MASACKIHGLQPPDDLLDALPARALQRRQQLGLGPVELGKGDRALLASLARDESDTRREVEASLNSMASPQEVVWAMEFGLARNVDAARQLLKHYPEGLRGLGEEVLAAKERLLAALRTFLERYPVGN